MWDGRCTSIDTDSLWRVPPSSPHVSKDSCICLLKGNGTLFAKVLHWKLFSCPIHVRSALPLFSIFARDTATETKPSFRDSRDPHSHVQFVLFSFCQNSDLLKSISKTRRQIFPHVFLHMVDLNVIKLFTKDEKKMSLGLFFFQIHVIVAARDTFFLTHINYMRQSNCKRHKI